MFECKISVPDPLIHPSPQNLLGNCQILYNVKEEHRGGTQLGNPKVKCMRVNHGFDQSNALDDQCTLQTNKETTDNLVECFPTYSKIFSFSLFQCILKKRSLLKVTYISEESNP